MCRIILLLCALLLSDGAFSQNKYWVFLKDKKGSTFNPYEYFDKLAIKRRLKQGINLFDSTDFPLCDDYVKKIAALADSVSWSTRWFNAIAVYADEEKINTISQLPFVKQIKPMDNYFKTASLKNINTELSDTDKDLLKGQIKSLQGDFFINNKYDAKGIRIAILDAGFSYSDNCDALDHIYLRKGVIETYDFYKKSSNVYKHDTHGTQVFCCLAGIFDSVNVGLAAGAEFLLGRTEDAMNERMADEEYWLAGLEWADKMGAKIVSSSLGHAWWFYFTENMDGKTSIVSRAANMAARKGMLVVTAAGNEGNNPNWKYILTPADADSALSIGGISHSTGIHIGFSSYGPTADGRMKPNVCAYGEVLSFDDEDEFVEGTSFACPLVAGFAACVWQKFPDYTNMQLFHEIEKSASLYPYYDYAHGFGVPQASYFFDKTMQMPDTTFDFEFKTGCVEIIVREKYINDKCAKADIMYAHVENEKGKLVEYFVWEVTEKKVKRFYLNISNFFVDTDKDRDLKEGYKVMVYYKGFVNTYIVK
jgi:hypothetical protein